MSNSLDHLLTGEERQAVEAFVTELHQQYPDRVQDVILLGSKARGDSHPASDIDILILVDDDDWRFSHAISRLAAGLAPFAADVPVAPGVADPYHTSYP